MNTLYTVQRINPGPDDTTYGPMHGSYYAEETVCGINVNGNWNGNWTILNNTFDGEITCEKCLEILNEKKNKEKSSPVPMPKMQG